ncbi:MAG: hypothetical protein P8Y62_03720 [candidate division WOR-3 bacterium]|jgi:hypothetical protein
MKKMILLALVLPVIVFAQISSVGSSPQSAGATLTFIIQTGVGIYVNNDVVWDFRDITLNPSNPVYPPAAYPEYYYPTSPNGSPYQQLEYMVSGSSSVNWVLTVSGDGDPGSGILLSDIEYSPAGMGSWDAFNTSAAPDTIESGSGNTGGWQSLNQDYRVNIDGDEEQTAGVSCVLTYTIQTD